MRRKVPPTLPAAAPQPSKEAAMSCCVQGRKATFVAVDGLGGCAGDDGATRELSAGFDAGAQHAPTNSTNTTNAVMR